MHVVTFTFLTVSGVLLSVGYASPVIIHQLPRTKVIAEKDQTTFLCIVSGTSFVLTWTVIFPDGHDIDIERNDSLEGFTLNIPTSNDDESYESATFSLIAEGRLENNNTSICCLIEYWENCATLCQCPEPTQLAYLIVIGVPSQPANLNATIGDDSLNLQWTPPYAHFEFKILFYWLCIRNSENNSIQTQLSGSLSEYNIFLNKTNTEVGPWRHCDTLFVSLTAKNSVGEGKAAFSEVILSVDVSNITCSYHVNTTYRNQSHIFVTVQFPHLCPQQSFQYSFVLIHKMTGQNISHQLREASYSGKNWLKTTLTADLDTIEVNSIYLLTVFFRTASEVTTASCLFRGNVRQHSTIGVHSASVMSHESQYHHKTTVTVSPTIQYMGKESQYQTLIYTIGSTTGLSLILILLTTAIVTTWRLYNNRRKTNQDEIVRAHNVQSSMVSNPIYESPLYETIHDQLNTLTLLPHAQESLYTLCPMSLSNGISDDLSSRNIHEEVVTSPHLMSEAFAGKGGATSDDWDDYIKMQSIITVSDSK